MTGQVLFIQGAGETTYDEWDSKLVRSLEHELGDGYSIRYPRMPDEGDPHYPAWKAVLVKEIAALDAGAVVIGHSVGGTMLIHTLAEEPPKQRLGAILLLAAPFIGEDGWPGDELNADANLAQNLPAEVPVLLYHGTADEIVPVDHLALYARAIPQATSRRLDGCDHQFDNDLGDIARDIHRLATTDGARRSS